MAHQALVHGRRRRKVVDNRAISGVDARQPRLLNGPAGAVGMVDGAIFNVGGVLVSVDVVGARGRLAELPCGGLLGWDLAHNGLESPERREVLG